MEKKFPEDMQDRGTLLQLSKKIGGTFEAADLTYLHFSLLPSFEGKSKTIPRSVYL